MAAEPGFKRTFLKRVGSNQLLSFPATRDSVYMPLSCAAVSGTHITTKGWRFRPSYTSSPTGLTLRLQFQALMSCHAAQFEAGYVVFNL